MNYESTFVVSPELPTDKVEELTVKAVKTIEASRGTVKTLQQLGKKKLAYPINKFREGSYVYMELNGAGEMVNSLENFFKFNDSVIRFLTIKVEKKKVVETTAAKVESSEVKTEVSEVRDDATK